MILARRFISFALLFSAFPFCAAAEDFTDAIHAYLQQCVHAEIPSGCIVVGILDERGSRIVSCGALDNGTDQEANGDTVFCIHSMTGTFTTLVLHDMVERGEMNLDDPAAKYLPESVKMPTRNGKEITLRNLASETSGFPDFHGELNPKRVDNPLADFTVEKMDAFVSGSQLAYDPGTHHFHGGVDKGLLGQAIEYTAGKSIESLMVDRILRPLKMDSTRFTLTPELKSRLASEHNEFGYAVPSWAWGPMEPLAGLYTTANDLLKFLSAIDVPPSSLSPLMEKWVDYFPYVSQGGGIVYTGGGVFGRRSYTCFDKTRHRGVVILSTSADLKRDFCDFLLESEWRSDRRPTGTKISSQIYGSYVGQYRCSIGAPSEAGIGIRRQGDRLFAQATGSTSSPDDVLLPPITGELVPESETRFFERLSGKPVTFSRDARGKVTGLTMAHQGEALSYKRISDQPPKAPEPVKPHVAIKLDAKLLDAIVGHYEFPRSTQSADGAKLTIWREGDQLVGQVWGKNAVQGAFDIYPESETNFFLKLDGSQLIFIKNEKREVTDVIHRSSHAGVPDSEGKKVNSE